MVVLSWWWWWRQTWTVRASHFKQNHLCNSIKRSATHSSLLRNLKQYLRSLSKVIVVVVGNATSAGRRIWHDSATPSRRNKNIQQHVRNRGLRNNLIQNFNDKKKKSWGTTLTRQALRPRPWQRLLPFGKSFRLCRSIRSTNLSTVTSQIKKTKSRGARAGCQFNPSFASSNAPMPTP